MPFAPHLRHLAGVPAYAARDSITAAQNDGTRPRRHRLLLPDSVWQRPIRFSDQAAEAGFSSWFYAIQQIRPVGWAKGLVWMTRRSEMVRSVEMGWVPGWLRPVVQERGSGAWRKSPEWYKIDISDMNEWGVTAHANMSGWMIPSILVNRLKLRQPGFHYLEFLSQMDSCRNPILRMDGVQFSHQIFCLFSSIRLV